MDRENKQNLGNNQIFLATTSLEDFWDTSKKIIFLGDWCRRYSRRHVWERLESDILPNLFDSQEKIRDIYKYINEVYEQLLEILTEKLNKIHGASYSQRYWRILIGMWLFYYVSVMYEKYTYIQEAQRKFPLFTTIGLSEDSFVVPRDTLDYVQYMKDDGYNLQLYTKILAIMGKNFPRKKMKVSNRPFGAPYKVSLPHLLFKNCIKKILMIVERTFQEGKPIILKNSYFSRFAELQLILHTFGKVWINNVGFVKLPLMPLNLEIRSDFKKIQLGNSEFEKSLVEILPLEIPQCYIESFAKVKDYASKNYPKKMKVIFTSNAWCFDEAFKHWAADAAECGTMLLGGQHGGNYGSVALLPSEDYEITVTDRFYSWGWEHLEFRKKVFPLPAPYLLGKKKFSVNNKKEGILLGAAIWRRYFFNFPDFSANFNDYLFWQYRFLTALNPKLKYLVRIRLHREDFGWDIVNQIRANFPEIPLEDWSVVFSKSLENCRLYVCDNLFTTFIEALSTNKPTVMFWNPKINVLRLEAEPYYEQLKKAGILYDNPEKAAFAVNSIYDDVESWWRNEGLQLRRKKFCDRFAWTSQTAIQEWVREFKQLASN